MFKEISAQDFAQRLKEGTIKELIRENGIEKTFEIIEQYKLASFRLSLRLIFYKITGM